MPTNPAREAGWYRHPDDERQHRYWTGEAWQNGEHTEAEAGAEEVDGSDDVE